MKLTILKQKNASVLKYFRTYTKIKFVLLIVYTKNILNADDAQIWSENKNCFKNRQREIACGLHKFAHGRSGFRETLFEYRCFRTFCWQKQDRLDKTIKESGENITSVASVNFLSTRNIFMINESKRIKWDGQIRNGVKIFIGVSEGICGVLHVN